MDRRMAIGDHFIHTCLIERPGGTTQDAYGNTASMWAVVGTNVACRLVEKDERVMVSERAESLVRTKYTLMLAAGADVLERDRVTVESAESSARVFTIAAVLKRNARGPHHVSVRLEIVE